MTTEEIIAQVMQACLTLRDGRIIEQFIFSGGMHVAATLGEKNGPICAPVLPYQIEGDAVVIADYNGEVLFRWESLDLSGKALVVQCSGRSKVFDIEWEEPRRRSLP